MLKVSAFYLEKHKSFISKRKYFLGHCQYQNKKDLFTDPIFSEGFGYPLALLQILLGRGIHIDFSSQLKFAKIEFYGAFNL